MSITPKDDGPKTLRQSAAMNTPRGAWENAITGYTEHMVAGSRRPQTIILRAYWLGRLANALGGTPWTVTPPQLIDWAASHTWGAETRRSVRASLMTFWRWGIDMGHTTTNPATVLPAITPPRAVPKPTPDDVVAVALFRASTRDALMICLAAHAGLRRAEIARCKWGDLAGAWLLVAGKGGHERRVPLSPVLREQLEEERVRRLAGGVGPGWRFAVDSRSPYVFPGLHGGHINVETVGAILGRALGPGWSGHTLRHRFATRALRGSKDLRAVQDLMGHASVVTTQRYTAVDEDALMAAARWAA